MAFRQPFIGLYITPRQIEAVYCQVARDGRVRVSSTHQLDLPDGVVDSEGIIQKDSVLATKIKELWHQARLPTRWVVLALWGKKSIVRLLQMPRMQSLYQAILAEAEGYALYREDSDLILDYHTLGAPEAETGPVIFTVSTLRTINAWRKCLKQAGLKVLAFDSAQMCAQRGLAFSHRSSAPWMGATLLPQKLIISYWTSGLVSIWREVTLAVDWEGEFQAMAESFESELARTLASESGLPKEYSILIAADNMDNSLQLGLFLNERQSVAAEVAGLFKLLMEEEIPGDIHRISLVSLGAALFGTQEPVPSFDLLRHEKTWVDAVAGVARQLIQPVADALVSQGVRSADALAVWYKMQGRYLVAGLVMGALLGGTALVVGWQQGRALARQSERLQSDIGRTQAIIEQQKQQPAQQAQAATQLEQVRQLIEGKRTNRFPLRFLLKLQENIPSDTWLSAVAAGEDSHLQIEGSALQKGSFFQFLNMVLESPEVRKLHTLESHAVLGAHEFKIVVQFNPLPSPSASPALRGATTTQL